LKVAGAGLFKGLTLPDAESTMHWWKKIDSKLIAARKCASNLHCAIRCYAHIQLFIIFNYLVTIYIWWDGVREDVKRFRLSQEDAQERNNGRRIVKGTTG